MRIFNVDDRTEILIDNLYRVWEKSVRETHLFLSDGEIKEIAKYVPSALKQIPHLVIMTNNEDKPVAFMGIQDKKLEMLFISPKERGKGLGKELIKYGIKKHSINELCVNEQNPQGKGFYEHMGFQIYKRTDIDEQGNPYPILYMRLP